MSATSRVLIACLASIAIAACAGTSPTAPTDAPNEPPPSNSPPPPDPPPPPPPPPPARGSVEVTINPNPVPFSGQPINDVASCAGRDNTWFYDQVIRETGGAAVTIRGRVDSFDGSVVNNRTDLNIAIPANGSVTISSRWCSVSPSEHTARTNFSGTDASGNAVSVNGPEVRLLAR